VLKSLETGVLRLFKTAAMLGMQQTIKPAVISTELYEC